MRGGCRYSGGGATLGVVGEGRAVGARTFAILLGLGEVVLHILRYALNLAIDVIQLPCPGVIGNAAVHLNTVALVAQHLKLLECCVELFVL